jgi:hypothetical protein
MEAYRLSDPRLFRERADALLVGDEARHNLILGISGILIDRPEVYPDYHLWVVEDGGRVVMAAVMTPPLQPDCVGLDR